MIGQQVSQEERLCLAIGQGGTVAAFYISGVASLSLHARPL